MLSGIWVFVAWFSVAAGLFQYFKGNHDTAAFFMAQGAFWLIAATRLEKSEK